MVFTNEFAANLMWNWIFVDVSTQPNQNGVTRLIFVRHHKEFSRLVLGDGENWENTCILVNNNQYGNFELERNSISV